MQNNLKNLQQRNLMYDKKSNLFPKCYSASYIQIFCYIYIILEKYKIYIIFNKLCAIIAFYVHKKYKI